MTWSSIQLRKLSLIGPGKQSASLKFRNGLNVICGASDAGKSFIVEAIDFFLGGNDPLRDIPERVGYDLGLITLQTTEEEIYTLSRSVEGGRFRLYPGYKDDCLTDDSIILKEVHKHGREDNLSGWLLGKTGLSNKKVRKNKDGETRSLSFRDLARLVIIQENEIIRRSSPFLTGQFISKTAEKSTLKLLITGVDDSALISTSQNLVGSNNVEAKIELITQWLTNLYDEVSGVSNDRKELEEQLEKLNEAIKLINTRFKLLQQNLDGKIISRREAHDIVEKIKNREDEIRDLLARFSLLQTHYLVDLERLEAIEESGTLFYFQTPSDCPLCGAVANQQHRTQTCEGDIEKIVFAAKIEKEKIQQLSEELLLTKIDLENELNKLQEESIQQRALFNKFDLEIKESLTPVIEEAHGDYSMLVEKKAEVKRDLDIHLRIDRLEQQREELSAESTEEEGTDNNKTLLSVAVLNEFSTKVEAILKAWHFPGAERVYFDEVSMDFVINGKPRGSRGKGLRAITHAAVSIALMEFCREKSLPHPGFVILDSPLLAYWAPEGADDTLQGTDLKDEFYKYLVKNHVDSQIIIFENEHPDQNVLERLNLTIFTKNPAQGRFGFFPVANT